MAVRRQQGVAVNRKGQKPEEENEITEGDGVCLLPGIASEYIPFRLAGRIGKQPFGDQQPGAAIVSCRSD